ncbi:hypothetical protein IFR05_005937 [Cadophora sp. M221]|nr:hypothetical protein IFR05_005937 [Cadophora sp. M221]
MGGQTAFESRLDYIFQPNTFQQDLGANGAGIDTIMNIGNEPGFSIPYLYNYLNKQWKRVQRNRQLANRYFHDANYGVPGNNDAGALNSWLVWQIPWFDDLNMTINGNQTMRIMVQNNAREDGNGQSGAGYGQDNFYVQSDVMVYGGTIEFELGPEPKVWETGDVPPSPGHAVL